MESAEFRVADREVSCRSVGELTSPVIPATSTTTDRLRFATDHFATEALPNVANSLPWWKRAMEIICILIALPVLLPVVAIISLLIKIKSPGPILFKQVRVGHRGKRFMLFKFRSMKLGASQAAHQLYLSRLIRSDLPMVKLDSQRDQRLIPCGRLLRASGLDELPQLINVLRGEMSLVGPRPCIEYEYEKFLPWQKERFNAVPGLTGLWQVSGKNRTTFDEMIRLDIRYAQNLSCWLDLKIMLKTPLAMAGQIWDSVLTSRQGAQWFRRPQRSRAYRIAEL